MLHSNTNLNNQNYIYRCLQSIFQVLMFDVFDTYIKVIILHLSFPGGWGLNLFIVYM